MTRKENKTMNVYQMLDELEQIELCDHLAMVRAKVGNLSIAEIRCLFKHYFHETGKGLTRSMMVNDVSEALMEDSKSPLYYDR